MIRLVVLFVSTVSLILLSGCGSPSDPALSSSGQPAAADSSAVAVEEKPQDDADAVAALEAAGAKLTKDRDGLVVEVDFVGSNAGDNPLEHLAGLQAVRKLRLNETGVTDAGMVLVAKASTLQDLDLRGCKISNAALEPLAALTGLKALRLSGKSGATNVDDDGMIHVGKLTNLKALLLDYLWVGDAGLEALKDLKDLEELYLAGTLVGDDCTERLKQFPKLRKVRLSQASSLSAVGLEHLAGITTLEDLDLSENSQIFDEGLTHLSGLTALKRLNLWRVQIGDTGVEKLKGLTALEWLNLDNTMLSDAGLPFLKDMTELTFLHLGSTSVTDEGLSNLEGLTKLKDLKVTRTNVTETGVASLKKKLPNTQIQLVYIEGQ